MKKATGKFSYYDASRYNLAVDPANPWQVISDWGMLIAKLPTEERAKAAVDALNEDVRAGVLPVRLNTWDKAHLLKGDES